MNDTISTAKILSLLDSLESARECRMYRVTLGDGSISRIAARSIADCHARVNEIHPGRLMLGIEELPKGDIS